MSNQELADELIADQKAAQKIIDDKKAREEQLRIEDEEREEERKKKEAAFEEMVNSPKGKLIKAWRDGKNNDYAYLRESKPQVNNPEVFISVTAPWILLVIAILSAVCAVSEITDPGWMYLFIGDKLWPIGESYLLHDMLLAIISFAVSISMFIMKSRFQKPNRVALGMVEDALENEDTEALVVFLDYLEENDSEVYKYIKKMKKK